jgi:hypothetical protein
MVINDHYIKHNITALFWYPLVRESIPQVWSFLMVLVEVAQSSIKLILRQNLECQG